MTKIIPTILTNNPVELQKKFKKLKGVTNLVQIDVMDGKFVNNKSVELETFKLYKNFDFELHLMVEHPEEYLKKASNLGVKSFIFHIESKANPKDLISKLREKDMNVGIALNPDTKAKKLDPFLGLIDTVLVLGVKPGFAGSKFQDKVLEKIKYFKSKGIKVEVDGGVDLENIEKIKKAGADIFAIGTGIFESKNVKNRFEKLKNKLS